MCSTDSSPLEALARVTDLLAGASGEGELPVDGESLAGLRRCIDRLEAVFVAALCRFDPWIFRPDMNAAVSVGFIQLTADGSLLI